MKRSMYLFLLLLSLVVIGCASQKKAVNNQSQMVGNDVDEHGCKASAGYMWSEVRQECVRLWDAGIRLSSVPDSESTVSTFVIFAPDSSSVELFLPQDATMLLERVKDESVWKNRWYSLYAASGKWILKKSGKTIYQSDN